MAEKKEIKKKNPFLAMFLSFLLFGLGQIYTGYVGFGIFLFLLIVLSLLFLWLVWNGLNWGVYILFSFLLLIWVYSIFDAYRCAHKGPPRKKKKKKKKQQVEEGVENQEITSSESQIDLNDQGQGSMG